MLTCPEKEENLLSNQTFQGAMVADLAADIEAGMEVVDLAAIEVT